MAAGGNGNTYPPFPMTATKSTMVAAFIGGTPVRRIRTPNPHDVLSGRGGGINNHKGNKAFREWVNQRKEDYNLAKNKKEKIAVAMQVVRQVQLQGPEPGRFLQRDPTVVGGNGGHWWLEINETKALAKTTQALREGAPKIRQAHQTSEESPEKTTEKAKKRKRKAPIAATSTETPLIDDATEKLVLQSVKQDASHLPRYRSEQMLLPTTDYSVALEQLQENVEKAKHEAYRQTVRVDTFQHQEQPLRPQATSPVTTLVAPLTSNKAFSKMYGEQNDVTSSKSRFNPLMMLEVDPFAETPPLMAAPEPDLADDIPTLSLDSGRTFFVDDIGNKSDLPSPNRKRKLHRVHSLALSDYDGTTLDPATDALVEFVNPFADESNVFVIENDPNVVMSHVPTSVFNRWNKIGNGNAVEDKKCTTEQSRSVGGYLNRLLSVSSCLADSNDSEVGSRLCRNDDNQNCESNNNNDYFFHDDSPESDFGETMRSTFDVVHPHRTSPEKCDCNSPMTCGGTININKNSTSSLIRRASFTSRNRALVSGRQ